MTGYIREMKGAHTVEAQILVLLFMEQLGNGGVNPAGSLLCQILEGLKRVRLRR